MAYTYEESHYGPVVSLAGVPSDAWRGFLITMNDELVTAGTTRTILSPNPNRMWAVIQHVTNDSTVGIYFGNANGGMILMPQYSIVQLDKNLPFSGTIIGRAGAADSTYKVIECSTQ